MTVLASDFDRMKAARLAGLLYLAIIMLGIWSEMVVRAALVAPGDAAATAAGIAAHEGLFRLGIAADSVMALCDAALAVLLFLLLRPVNATVALMAMAFRLIQTAILGVNLLNLQATLLAIGDGGNGTETARRSLELHSFGYDLGLVFFGVNCLLTGWLLLRSGWLHGVFGYGLMAAGGVYLAGSYLRILAPALSSGFAPAYAVPLAAELGFCLWLLVKGLPTRRAA
ncbi:DUF4386 domain-containing protein [Parvibaculum sp.]|uniref:DUF4386 domain-containing protein n=1 Tax=Parvibaculum sp. TaxID=2024848 RepID=UPI0025D57E07|nr:DUF4386 domain-containing protein [Parvibaculum sp.]